MTGRRSWRVYYVSGESSLVEAERYVADGEWMDFLLADGTPVRRERATEITRIILKERPAQRADGAGTSPPAR